jgi:hypothetical protein
VPAVARHVRRSRRRADLQDVGIDLGRRRVDGAQFAEGGGEALVMLGGDRLIAEDEDVVVVEGGPDLFQLLRRDLLRQVDARDFRPQNRGDPVDGESAVGVGGTRGHRFQCFAFV